MNLLSLPQLKGVQTIPGEFRLFYMQKGDGIEMIDGDGRCEFYQHCASIKFKVDEKEEQSVNSKNTILYCVNNHKDCARYQLAEWLVDKKGESRPGIQGVPPNLQPNEYTVAATFKKASIKSPPRLKGVVK